MKKEYSQHKAGNLKSEGAATYHNIFKFLIFHLAKIVDSQAIFLT